MGNLDQIPNSVSNFQDQVVKFHKTQTKFSYVMICLAIATIIAATFTGILSYQTGMIIEDIKKINEAEFKIDNPTPFAQAKSSLIYLDRNYTQLPKHDFGGIEIDPFSNHSLRIAVADVTIIESSSNSFCMFEEIPKVRLFQGDSVVWKVGEESKKLEPSLSIDYKIKNEFLVSKNSDEKPVRQSIASVIFELQIQDLQNDLITKDNAYSSLIVWIDHTEMGLTC